MYIPALYYDIHGCSIKFIIAVDVTLFNTGNNIISYSSMVSSQICRDNVIRYYVTSVNETAVLLLMISASLARYNLISWAVSLTINSSGPQEVS